MLLYAGAGAVSHTRRRRAHKLPAKGVLPCAAQNPRTPCVLCRSGRFVCGHGSLRWGCVPSALQGSSDGCSGCNYAPAAGTPSGRWGSSCGTPLCPPTGARYTAPMAHCWPPTAAAGPCVPAPGRCRRISLPLPPRGLPRYWNWTRQSCWKSSATDAPTTAFCATGWSGKPPMPCGISARRTALPACASIRIPSAGTRRGSCWPRCWDLPTWTTPGSAGWS